jgi:hypothetical protein
MTLLIFCFILSIICLTIAAGAVLYYIGTFALYCIYRHNGGKHGYTKYLKVKGLEL